MCAAILFALAAVAFTSDGSTLTGRIQDESGMPLAGAIVDIYKAKPRA
jgi:protocatechuate 3,4-dioxygenase beta subunit